MNADYHLWKFTIDDGRELYARYTDEEIFEMKKSNPEINWKS